MPTTRHSSLRRFPSRCEKPEEPPARPAGTSGLPDDRGRLIAAARTILVVEDDPVFARILYDLAHEQNFQCLLASTAEEALQLTRQYLPSAVLLDVGLP